MTPDQLGSCPNGPYLFKGASPVHYRGSENAGGDEIVTRYYTRSAKMPAFIRLLASSRFFDVTSRCQLA
jgi:hypothetical protein